MQVSDQIENKKPRLRGVFKRWHSVPAKNIYNQQPLHNGVKTRRTEMPISYSIYIVMQIFIIT